MSNKFTMEEVIAHQKKHGFYLEPVFDQPFPPHLQMQKNYDQNKAVVARSGAVVQKLEAGAAARQAANPDDEACVPRADGEHGGGVRCAVTAHFHYSDRRRRDLDGAMTTVLDCLVKAKAITDDNRFVVSELHAYGHDCDKGDDHVVVEIEARP